MEVIREEHNLEVQHRAPMNNVCSPFLHPQQVPGTPLFGSDHPFSITSPGSYVPDIDDLHTNPFIPYTRRTPKSAPSTPGMTVPSCSASPASSIKELKQRRLSTRPRKKDSREQSIKSTTPKLEQVVPSCSPLLPNQKLSQTSKTDKNNCESTKQISLFSGDEIFA